MLTQYTTDHQVLTTRRKRLFARPNSGAYLLEALVDVSRGLAKREAKRPVILAITFENGAEFSNQHYEHVLRDLQKSGAALHVDRHRHAVQLVERRDAQSQPGALGRHVAHRRPPRSGAGQLAGCPTS